MGAQLRKAREDKGLKRPLFVQRLKGSLKAPVESHTEMTVERLKQWEYGNNPIGHEWIPAICEVLACDVGYLFGDYPEKTREISDICSITGLSAAAVNVIIGDKQDGYRNDKLEALNFLLTSSNFENALCDLVRFKQAEEEVVALEEGQKRAIAKLKDISEYHPNTMLLELISDKRQDALLCEYRLFKSLTFLVDELRRVVDEGELKNG